MPIYFKSFASDFNIMFQIPMNIVKTFFINLFIAFGKFSPKWILHYMCDVKKCQRI